jgi:hypothetical protein
MMLEITARPRRIALILGIVAIYLAAQSIFGEYINTNVLHGRFSSVPALVLDEFSVNAEQTIPTWFQVLLLFVISVLLAVIARAKRASKDAYTPYWAALAIMFVYLSMDEAAAIHEIVSDPLHAAFQTTGILAFGWQILAAPLVIIFGLIFLRFLFHLPPRTRNLFILAGALYVGGALVTDAVSASLLPSDNELSLQYLAVGTLEELLEMAGMVVFIYTLLAYIAEMQVGLIVRSASVTQQPFDRVTDARGVGPIQPDAAVAAEQPTNRAARNSQSRRVRRLTILAVLLIVGMNAALVYWAMTQDSPLAAEATDTVPVYQAIIEQFPANGLVVTHLNSRFDAENASSRQFAASLLTTFRQVMVIVLPPTGESIFVAGDSLPFDRGALSDVVRSTGEAQFIIFDTPAVRQIVGNNQAPK